MCECDSTVVNVKVNFWRTLNWQLSIFSWFTGAYLTRGRIHRGTTSIRPRYPAYSDVPMNETHRNVRNDVLAIHNPAYRVDIEVRRVSYDVQDSSRWRR